MSKPRGPKAKGKPTTTTTALESTVSSAKAIAEPLAAAAASSGSGSFATVMIIGPTCFFLGILFAFFPYDYPLLWTATPPPPAYYAQLERHVQFVHQSPPLIGRLLNMVVMVGLGGFALKLLVRARASNYLFDGASLILYGIGVAVYATNIVKAFRMVSANLWDDDEAWAAELAAAERAGEIVLGREDSLRVLSASNTILALILVGVLVLQAGQWYADYKDQEEEHAFRLSDAAAAPPVVVVQGPPPASESARKSDDLDRPDEEEDHEGHE